MPANSREDQEKVPPTLLSSGRGMSQLFPGSLFNGSSLTDSWPCTLHDRSLEGGVRVSSHESHSGTAGSRDPTAHGQSHGSMSTRGDSTMPRGGVECFLLFCC